MEIRYIKVNGKYFHPQKPGVQHPDKIKGCFFPICIITKLWFGRFQIDFHDDMHWIGYATDDQKPNTRLIVYPNGIEEISYNVNHTEP